LADVRPLGGQRLGNRRCRVIIEVTYAAGRLADDRRDMLTAQIHVRGAGASQFLAVTVSPDAVSILTVTATVDAANPGVAFAVVDDALDQALMMTGLFEEFDVSGKVLLAGPLERAERIPAAVSRRRASSGISPRSHC
jgi:hypothetical protein